MLPNTSKSDSGSEIPQEILPDPDIDTENIPTTIFEYELYKDEYVQFKYPKGWNVNVQSGKLSNISETPQPFSGLENYAEIPKGTEFEGVRYIGIESPDSKFSLGIIDSAGGYGDGDGSYKYSPDRPNQLFHNTGFEDKPIELESTPKILEIDFLNLLFLNFIRPDSSGIYEFFPSGVLFVDEETDGNYRSAADFSTAWYGFFNNSQKYRVPFIGGKGKIGGELTSLPAETVWIDIICKSENETDTEVCNEFSNIFFDSGEWIMDLEEFSEGKLLSIPIEIEEDCNEKEKCSIIDLTSGEELYTIKDCNISSEYCMGESGFGGVEKTERGIKLSHNEYSEISNYSRVTNFEYDYITNTLTTLGQECRITYPKKIFDCKDFNPIYLEMQGECFENSTGVCTITDKQSNKTLHTLRDCTNGTDLNFDCEKGKFGQDSQYSEFLRGPDAKIRIIYSEPWPKVEGTKIKTYEFVNETREFNLLDEYCRSDKSHGDRCD